MEDITLALDISASPEYISDTEDVPRHQAKTAPDQPPAYSLRAALRSHSPLWALHMAHNALRARIQLRHCSAVGSWVRVRGRVRVRNEGRIVIRDRVRFFAETVPSEIVAWPGGALEIGAGTTINYGASISAASSVRIGHNCLIGTYVNIMDCTFHNAVDRSWTLDAEPIIIEDDVWLGNRCVIMKGVRIGRGATVAACSLVTRDVPAGSLVAGVPARVVKHL